MSEPTECDFLIVGGGTAGCILARRLADATRGRIILVEAGRSDEGDPLATNLSRLDDQDESYGWGYLARPLAGGPEQLKYALARMLGGCGNHNDCAFLQPPDSDFADWERLGAKGWGPAGVRPYFERVRSQVNVEHHASSNPVSLALVNAARELGLPEVDFRQGIVPGTGWFPLNARGPLRQSASVAYLHPLADRPRHLEVRTRTQALRLLVEDGRAAGIVNDQGTIRARREVVLTAGSIGTAKLLLLSGIGPAADLRALGLPVVRDLPVGRHLLDHVAAAVVWDLHKPPPAWELTPFEALMMIQVEADAPAPDVLFHLGLRVREKYADRPRFGELGNGVKASPNVARARSEGSIRLRSADPHAPPVIDLDYLSDPEGYDRRVLLAALRFGRRLIEAPTWRALVRREACPGPDVQSDDEWLGYVREVCETVYHPAGTCRLGEPGRPGTVVGPDLRLQGLAGLRVADASVFPAMVTVNINQTVMMLAEKAADLVLADVRAAGL